MITRALITKCDLCCTLHSSMTHINAFLGGWKAPSISKATRQKKNGYFMVRLTVKEGGQPLGPDRKQMWKFWPIFFLKFDSLILNTHFISSWRGSKMYFSCPLRLNWYHHILTFMGPSEKDYLWQSYWIKIMKRLPAHKMTAILTTSLMSWSQKMNAVFVFFISSKTTYNLW